MRVELTERGSLLIPAEVSRTCFNDAPSVLVGGRAEELRLIAIGPRAVGGLILKQRNLRGDRAVLVVGPTAYKAARAIRLSNRPVILPENLYHRERDPMTGELDEVFLPLEMHRAGIEFSLVPGDGSMAEGYLNYLAALCVREGLPRQAALEAITMNPARALGMEDALGSLEPGKLGNVVVFSGDPLAFDSWVEHVFIEGMHAYDRSKDPRLEELMKLEAGADADEADDAAEADGADDDASPEDGADG